MESRTLRESAARAATRFDPATLGLTAFQFHRSMAVPWRRAVLRFKPKGMLLRDVYREMGWPPGTLTSRTRYPNLRVLEAARLARVCKAPVGKFLAALAEELEKDAEVNA